MPFKKALIARQDQGRYYWELRSCDYMEQFNRPKIMWQVIQFHSQYCWEEGKAVFNDKVFFLPTDDIALLGVLGSPLQWWHLTRALPHMKDEALNPAAFLMEQLRITTGSPAQTEGIKSTVAKLLNASAESHAFEAQAADEVRRRLSLPLPDGDGRIGSLLPLPSETFASRLLKLASAKKPTTKQRDEILAFQQRQRKRQVELLTLRLNLERKLAVLVEDAYGLTAEERALMRSTRPVRDPLDVLEAKIRGGVEAADESDAEE